MSTNVGRIDLDLGLDYKQFNRELSGIASTAESQVGSAFRNLGMIIAGAFAVDKLIGFGQQSLKLASDLNEVQNVVDVTFGKMSYHIDAFAKTALEKFGMSELSAKRFAGTMGAMMKSSGLAGNTLVKVSEDLSGLAGDFASFYNLRLEDAFYKIQAGISGEVEPLKQLGINMSVANMEAYALAQGIKKKYEAMTQAEQVLLRYNYLLSVSKDAQGDFIRTSDGWANQTRLLNEQWKIFQTTMGQGFINILAPVVKGLNFLIQKLQIAAQYFLAFTQMITGVKKKLAGPSGATGAMDGLSASSDGLSKSSDGVAKSAKKAGKAVKGSLASFDQLNVITQSTAGAMNDAAGGLGGLLGGSGDMELPDIPTFEAPKIDDSILKKFTSSINFQPLIDSFNRLKEALIPLGQTLWAGLKWGYDNVLVPLAKWTIEDLLPAFLNLLAGALKVVNPLLTAFAPIAKGIWDNFLKPLASWTGGVIVDTLNGVADILTDIGNWMSKNQKVVTGFTEVVLTFFGAWQVVKLAAFIQMSGGIVGAFNAITKAIWAATIAKAANAYETAALTVLYAVDFFKSIAALTVQLGRQAMAWGIVTGGIIANRIALVTSTIAQWAMTASVVAYNIAAGIGAAVTTAFGIAVAILTSPITLVIAAIALLVAGVYLLIKHWDDVKKAGATAWEAIKLAWGVAVEWFKVTVLTPIWTAFTEAFGLVKAKALGAWDYVKQTWDGAATWMGETVITPIKTAFTKAWNAVGDVAGSVWEGMKTVWRGAAEWLRKNVTDPIGNMFIGLFNGIIGGLNAVIRALNSLKIDIPDWVPGVGGQSFGVSLPEIPRIPKLAKGGMVAAPTLAMVGDNKNAAVDPEVVSPLSKLQDMLAYSNQGVIEALMMILDAIENKETALEIDGEKLTRYVRGKLRIEDSRVGQSAVTIGGVALR